MFSKTIILTTLTTLSLLLAGCPAPTSTANTSNNSVSNNSTVNTKSGGGSTKTAETGKEIAIADGRVDSSPVTPPAAEIGIAEKAIEESKAAIAASSTVKCDDGDPKASVLGSASGAFTKPGASQKAYLFEYCRAGRSFGIGGIVITEGEAAVATYVFGRGVLYSSIGSVNDVNANGTDEVVLAGGGTGQGYTESSVTLFEFISGNGVDLGRASTFSDNSGAATADSKIVTTAYKITAESGKSPTFYRQTFEKKGGAATWSESKAREPFSLEKSEGEGLKKIQ